MPARPELFVVAIVVLGLETIAALMWLPVYFRFGVPILRLSFPWPRAVSGLPAASSLRQAFQSGWTGNMLFKELSPVEIAFREAQVGMTFLDYLPVLLIRFRPDQQRAEIVGYLNYSNLVLILALAASVRADWRLMATPFFIGLFGVLPFCIQAYRYTRIRAMVGDYVDACVMASHAPTVKRR